MELYPSVTALDLPFKKKLQESLKIWGYCFLGFIVSAIIISFTDLLIKMAFHIDIAKTNQITTVFSSPIQKFLLFPFLVPFLEECIFRLWQDYKVSHLIMAAGLILTLILFRITGIHLSAFKYIYEGILALLALIFMVSTRKSTTPALSVSLKKRKIFYYLAAIIFGLGHIFNFAPIHYNLIYFYPVFVLPQLIMGFGFGYVRIKYGFFFGWLLHCITNTLPLLFHLLIGSI